MPVLQNLQLTPLRYWRFTKFDNSGMVSRQYTKAIYGRRSYLTHDGRFVITHGDEGWIVRPHNGSALFEYKLAATGIFSTRFPRRRDAIEALAATLEVEGFTSA